MKLLPVLVLAVLSTGAPASSPAVWTGTWAVAPQRGNAPFRAQTLRQIVHTSVAGNAARVRLSNLYGDRPLRVEDVHLARRGSGAAIVPESDRAVLFAGQSSVTIAVGASSVSDEVSFPVAALSDVAVSFYLPEDAGAATVHQVGSQTNYIAEGDASGSPNLENAQTFASYAFLTNLDVVNERASGAIVALGASITDGVGAPSDTNQRWPNALATRLDAAGLSIGVLDQGISGNKLLLDGAGDSALHRFARDVVGQAGVRWVIFADNPINDLGASNPRPSGSQLVDGTKRLIADAHAAGLAFLCSTLTPFEGAFYWTAEGEAGRAEVNAFVRSAESGCDGVVDQDTATHDPAHPTRFLPAYDSGDHLHPNAAGLKAIADAVDLARFAARP